MINSILSAASVFRTIGSVLLAILILLVMITIHEFGHWVAGKILHFGINEFSIGFGPALFKHKSKKSGQLFAIRLIPLGGYCSFKSEDGLDDEEEKKEKEKKEEDASPQSEEEKPNETATEAVSTDTVILTPAPEEVKEEKKEEDFFAEPVEPNAEEGKKKKRVPAWKELPDDGSFTRKAPWKRIIVLVAGALMNYLLALFLIVICFFAYGQQMTATYKAEKPLDGVPAENCIQDLDVFLKADGKNLYLTTDLARAVNGKKAGETVKLYISRAIDVVWEKDENGRDVPKYD
ncbi:MAG: site-2 protease family protein, partial [Clostridia bacterium]|nr:site-2 protease family protein [Clostridia bacterium]